jgi:hypothetical protein
MHKLICALLLLTPLAVAADISGTWQVTVETNQGSGTPTVIFQQAGEKLTGTFKSQLFGDVPLTGSVKDNAIEFTFEAEAGGQKLKVAYKGAIDTPTTMKGTAVYEGFDDKATWSATRK